MTPDLGKYAFAVLGSYVVSLVLIAAVIVLSLVRSRRVRAELKRIEERLRNG
ncbi:heme exporter protein CcmD [Salipiger mucosus]|uniref:Heme exporter protein D n=1 Tax=Salipiger mucosus DSM 16094 TaxID=1123237 RepID=S9Q8B4_9RHOB|nr:heme exporter protein CcmD [Salipiger mucosus]EPX76262.1 Cytochrome c-type biogenesis protein CcmD, interacts with CcmCE [Salipiger mucosus DSM 16094]